MSFIKSGNIIPNQKEIMLDYIHKRPEMHRGKITKSYSREKSFRLWKELTHLLNSVPGGPIKDCNQWRKCWVDLKKNTKAKLRLSSNSIEPPVHEQLDEVKVELPPSLVVDSPVLESEHSENYCKRTKSGSITPRQKEILIDFIRSRPEMHTGRYTRTYTRKNSLMVWRQLTQLLNSVPDSPVKEWYQWRKCWVDLKKNSKAKYGKNILESSSESVESFYCENSNEPPTEEMSEDTCSPDLKLKDSEYTMENVKKTEKSANITPGQKEILMGFIRRRPEMHCGKITKLYPREKHIKHWKELTQLLNSVAGAPTKDWRQWRRCWIDARKNLRAKLAKNRSYITARDIERLDEVNSRLIEIVAPNTMFEDSSTAEPVEEFKSEENICDSHFETGSTENIIEYAHIEEEPSDTAFCSSDHDICTSKVVEDEEDESKKGSTAGIDAVKREKNITLKKRRLQNRYRVPQTNKNINIHQKYYAKKLKLMERDINNKELYFKKKLELGEKLLKELSEVKALLMCRT